MNAQGEDVVAGIRTPQPDQPREPRAPGRSSCRRSRRRCRAPTASSCAIDQRLERTTATCRTSSSRSSSGKLWMLQTRTGKRTARAAVRIAVDMVEGGADPPRGGGRCASTRTRSTSCCTRRSIPKRRAHGRRARACRRRRARRSGRVVFVAPTRPRRARKGGREGDPRAHRDLARRHPRHARGAGHPHRARRHDLARRGRRARHGQVLRRRLRRAAHRLRGAASSGVGGSVVREGDAITLDGGTGEVMLGAVADRRRPSSAARSRELMALGRPRARARACAPTPTRRTDARVARAVRRRGHRPLPHRAHVLRAGPHPRRARDDPRRRRAPARERALAKLLPMQRERLRGDLPRDGRAAGHDPPARPAAARVPAARRRRRSREVARRARHATSRRCARRSTSCASSTRCSATAAAGSASPIPRSTACRCARSSRPRCEVAEAGMRDPARDHDPARRARARARAAARARRSRRSRRCCARVPRVARAAQRSARMIEVPRAALTADAHRRARRLLLVRHQRPHPDGLRALARRRRQVPARLPRDAASSPTTRSSRSTRTGIGALMRARRARRGARTRPDLKLGICGEHGGDPQSVALLRARRASTTCRARRSACRSRGSRRRRRPSAAGATLGRRGARDEATVGAAPALALALGASGCARLPARRFGRTGAARRPLPADPELRRRGRGRTRRCVEFHERAAAFYGRLAHRRFDSIETFRDEVLRDYFRTERRVLRLLRRPRPGALSTPTSSGTGRPRSRCSSSASRGRATRASRAHRRRGRPAAAARQRRARARATAGSAVDGTWWIVPGSSDQRVPGRAISHGAG